jgi:hypothetical protein
MSDRSRRVRRAAILTSIVVAMAGAGFIFKIYEFVQSLKDSAAMGFAIVPLSSYFLTGAGFLLLLLWSASKGAFKDVEGPKYRMMFLEEGYARQEGNDATEWDLDNEDIDREELLRGGANT